MEEEEHRTAKERNSVNKRREEREGRRKRERKR